MNKTTRTEHLDRSNSASLMRELPGDTSAYPAGCNLHIFPDGAFRTDDGRPAKQTNGKLTAWRIDQAIADALIAACNKPVLVDCDHASQYGDTSAKGWVTVLHYEPGQGLFGKCEWVGNAAELVASKTFRYLSPYFQFNPISGAPLKLLSVALTNDPALDSLGAVALSRNPTQPQPGDDPMKTVLAAALKMTADSSDAAVQEAALTAIHQVAALTAERDTARARVTELETAQAAAAAAAILAERDALIAAACTADKDGRAKLTPAMAEFAKTLGLAACKTYIETQPAINLSRQSSPDDKGDGLTEADRAMCARMGVAPDEFKKYRQAC